MSAAWNDAVRLIAGNRQVMLVVAGVFFFLPAVVYGFAFTNQITAIQNTQGASPDMEDVFRAVSALVDDVWWIILLTMAVQWLGSLVLVVLWTDRSRPTVGEAIKLGLALLLPLLGAQLVLGVVWGLLLLLPLAIGAGGSVGVAVLVGLLAFAALVYSYVKFSLVGVVVGIERTRNPLAALGRSWRVTKGNGFRLLLFILLLFVALIVLSSVASLMIGLVLALAGAEVALIGRTLAEGAVSAAFSVIFLATLVAIYRQLANVPAREVSQTTP